MHESQVEITVSIRVTIVSVNSLCSRALRTMPRSQILTDTRSFDTRTNRNRTAQQQVSVENNRIA
jgi:hypothetical protein